MQVDPPTWIELKYEYFLGDWNTSQKSYLPIKVSVAITILYFIRSVGIGEM